MVSQTQSEPASTYLDVDALKERFSGKPQLLSVMRQEFSALLQNHLPKMHTAYSQGNLEILKDLAHTLKGNAALIGAHLVQNMAWKVELAAGKGQSDVLQSVLEQLPGTIRQTVEHLGKVSVS